MNPWIVIEVPSVTRMSVIAENGLHEYTVDVPVNIGEHDISNIYTRPDNSSFLLARNEVDAQAIASMCARKQPGTKWMWFELRGIALCKPGDVEITQVTEKGALPV